MTLVLALGIVSITAGCKVIVKKPHDDHERRMRNAIRINPVHELGYIRLAQYLKASIAMLKLLKCCVMLSSIFLNP